MYDYDAVENLNCNDNIANIVNFGENKIVFKISNKNLINSRIKKKLNVLAKSKTVCQKCFKKSPL